MKNNFRMSIITSTYKDSNFDISLKSILNQTHENYEIILICDYPLDYEDIKNKYSKYEYLTIVKNDINIGLTKSLNKALKLATGDIIIRHDMDDLSLPNRLEQIDKTFRNHKDIDIISSFAYHVTLENLDDESKLLTAPINDLEIKKILQKRNCLIHPSVAFKKNIFYKLGGYSESFKYAQDYDLYLRAINFKFYTIQEALIKKVYSKDNITVKHRKQQLYYSLAALALYNARKEFNIKSFFNLLPTIIKIIIPDSMRTIKNKVLK